jgi:hypothetical protein
MCACCKGAGVIPFDYLNMVGGRFCVCPFGKEAEELIYNIVCPDPASSRDGVVDEEEVLSA